MAQVSRDRAREILEAIAVNLDHLEPVETVSKIDVNPHFDSELESKFIESLRRLGGKDGLSPVRIVQDIVHGKSGYLLEVGSQRYWIEPQVDLGATEGVLISSRPDFVLWPAQTISPRKPVAVFCDGWNYHKKITREDASKRNAILAGGKFWVWSVTWEDVKTAVAGGTETDLSGTLDEMALGPLPAQLQPLCDPRRWTRNAVAGLLEWLQTKPDEGTDAPANGIGRHSAASAFRMVPNPGKPESLRIQEELNSFWNSLPQPWPCEKPAGSFPAGNINSPTLAFRYFATRESVNTKLPLSVSPGFWVYDPASAESEPEMQKAWRRWVWMFNTLQFLPGVYLATRDGLKNGDHSRIRAVESARPASSSQSTAYAGGWTKVMEQAMESLYPGLEKLMAQGVPVPDEVGFELEQDGEVVAECELAWTNQKVVLLLEPHRPTGASWTQAGWRVVYDEADWPEKVAAEIQQQSSR